MTDAQFLERVALLNRLGLLAFGGALLLALAYFLPTTAAQVSAAVAGGLALIPAAFYLVLLTLWHWKSRYRGTHSDLWGGLLVLETSGWFKLVYLFRHIIPDARGTGRYARVSAERPA